MNRMLTDGPAGGHKLTATTFIQRLNTSGASARHPEVKPVPPPASRITSEFPNGVSGDELASRVLLRRGRSHRRSFVAYFVTALHTPDIIVADCNGPQVVAHKAPQPRVVGPSRAQGQRVIHTN